MYAWIIEADIHRLKEALRETRDPVRAAPIKARLNRLQATMQRLRVEALDQQAAPPSDSPRPRRSIIIG